MESLRNDDDVLVIALHGVALSTAEVERIAEPLENGFPMKRVRWLFPKAPWRPITLLGGRCGLAWYDVLAWDGSCIDEVGLERATQWLGDLIEAERRVHPSRGRIVLAGFSHGGALALHAGVRLGAAVTGVVAIASALPCRELLPASPRQSPPFFLAHGLFDTVVPFSMGRESMRALVEKGYRIDWHAYPVGHWINARCLQDVARWIDRTVLGTCIESRAPARRARQGCQRLPWRSGLPA